MSRKKHNSFIRLSPYLITNFYIIKTIYKIVLWFLICGESSHIWPCILRVFGMCCHVFVHSTLKDVVKRVWVLSDECGCPTWTRHDIRSIVLLGLEMRRIWERRHIVPLSSFTYAFPVIIYEDHLFVMIFYAGNSTAADIKHQRIC